MWTTLFLLIALASAHNVSYDGRSLTIDGKRSLMISGSIHYPRSTPSMWPALLNASKEGGLNFVETYLFWNGHEPTPGNYYFGDNYDVFSFIEEAQKQGLYVILRVGPYVCAEWNYGGFPVWLRDIPNIVFRTYNEPYLTAMEKWVRYIVAKLQERKLFASQGGPIVLAQVENEYGNVEGAYGSEGKKYVEWSANLAISLKTGIPWIMCAQDDAPPIVLNTCNGFYCDNWIQGHEKAFSNEPSLWTENWPGWFQLWGEPIPRRPVEDVSFAVLRWFARGGSGMNYYMYHGGTNFGRTVGGPFIITSYDYDAPLNEFGHPHNPKYSHLTAMHTVLHQHADVILQGTPSYQSFGDDMEAHVYNMTSGCIAFLSNINSNHDGSVTFSGRVYNLPAWSVTILADCVDVAFVSARPSGVETKREMRTLWKATKEESMFFPDIVGGMQEKLGIEMVGPAEQLSVTHDATDFLWYSTKYLSTKAQPCTLVVSDVHDVTSLFVNGALVTSTTASTVTSVVNLAEGDNSIDILVRTVGLQNYGEFLERVQRGIKGTVSLCTQDITKTNWTHTPFVAGEVLKAYDNQSAAEWMSDATQATNVPISWFKYNVGELDDAPYYGVVVNGLNKGELFVNGHMLGRYWNSIASGICSGCDYRGPFGSDKCRFGCGGKSQEVYHLPRDWIVAGGNNVVVVFEEVGAPNPLDVSIVGVTFS